MKGQEGRSVTLLAALALIVAATLRPASAAIPLAGPWCIVCGQHGTIDIVQNILLFVPLGMAAQRRGLSGRALLVVVLALSTAIELLQYVAIVGRDGAIGDVLANTVGGAIGHRLATWGLAVLRPAPAHAATAFLTAVVVWGSMVGLSLLSLRPAAPDGVFALIRRLPATPDGPASVVHAATLNGSTLRLDAPIDPALRAELLAPRSAIELIVTPDDSTPEYQSLGRLASETATLATLGQDGRDFVCSRYMLAATLRLRTPVFLLPDAFPSPRSPRAGSHRVACVRDHHTLRLGNAYGDSIIEGSVPLSAGLGWSLWIPGRHHAAHHAAVRWPNVLWLLTLALPVGYYGAVLNADGAPAPLRRPRSWGVVVLAVAAGQWLLPMLTGAASPWWELLGTAAGLAAGAAAAFLVDARFGRA